MSDVTGDLLETFARIAAQADAGEPVDVAEELRSLPVVLRAALAVAVLAAADRPISGVTVATAGGFSRGTAYRNNRGPSTPSPLPSPMSSTQCSPGHGRAPPARPSVPPFSSVTTPSPISGRRCEKPPRNGM